MKLSQIARQLELNARAGLATMIWGAVEVHLSDISARESFRRHSYISAACLATIAGRHFEGYREAASLLISHLP